MLTLSQVKEKYDSDIFQRNPKAALVEYLQYEILDSIFKQHNSEKLSFMGGTSIRLVYGSRRFSEDLDFDNFGLSYEKFEEILMGVVSDMKNKGFSMEFRFVKKGAYHCYIKFTNMLFDNNISLNKNEKILVRIDAVHKNKIIEPKIFTLNGFDVYRRILVNQPSVLLAQKIMAIIERKREKGRDIYDVSYLLGITGLNNEFIEKEYALKIEDFKNKFIKRIDELNLNELALDVLPFLMNQDDKDRILSFKEYIKEKI